KWRSRANERGKDAAAYPPSWAIMILFCEVLHEMDSLDFCRARCSSDSHHAHRIFASKGAHGRAGSPLPPTSGSNLENHYRYRCDARLAARTEKRQASSRPKRAAGLGRDARFRNHSIGNAYITA